MNSTLKIILISLAVFVVGTFLLFGVMIFAHNSYWMGNGISNSWFGWHRNFNRIGNAGYYNGMMGGNGFSNGMMGSSRFQPSVDYEPLTSEETVTAVENYIGQYGNQDLLIAEIMIFDNNAYAIITEASTGIGAFELLVDPVSKLAYPEYGANMMWNTKYGMGNGMMGGNRFGGGSETMIISPEKALEIAQQYLDASGTGESVSDEITQFYGYFTIDTIKNGSVNGMLSVNGYDGTVLYHSWHGTFISMAEEF